MECPFKDSKEMSRLLTTEGIIPRAHGICL